MIRLLAVLGLERIVSTIRNVRRPHLQTRPGGQSHLLPHMEYEGEKTGDSLFWNSKREVEPGTALEHQVLNELISELSNSLPSALELFANHLESIDPISGLPDV
ncbi:MAG: hypothetical protein AAGG48_27720 [Planctomycetota bacterium]